MRKLIALLMVILGVVVWSEDALAQRQLAKAIVGEVSVVSEPNPAGGVVQVLAGTETVFAYDIKAELDSGNLGFDVLSLYLPSAKGIGDVTLQIAGRDVGIRIELKTDSLIVILPRSVRENNLLVRVTFKMAISSPGTYALTGEVGNSAIRGLPQAITPGDANPEVATNTLTVVVVGATTTAAENTTWGHVKSLSK